MSEEVAYNPDDVKEFIFDYLGNFFTDIDEGVEVALEEKTDGFYINLNADNNAVLIGKEGRTISAFNSVLKAAVNSKFNTHIDVVLDVNHYKENRYENIKRLAKRVAKQVQKTHVPADLDPMPNDERKVIHRALNNWHNISTQSEGEGNDRHICIRYVEDDTAAEEKE